MRWLPNFLTGVRAILTPVIVYLIAQRQCAAALPITVFAGLTDAADGYLARRLGVSGRLGAWLDPIADKLLLTALYLTFGFVGLVPDWLVWLVVGRDIIILTLAALGLFVAAIRDFPPTIWGKISTALQIAGTLVFLSACAGWAWAAGLAETTVWAVAIATAWSGMHYVYSAGLRFREWRTGDGTNPHKV